MQRLRADLTKEGWLLPVSNNYILSNIKNFPVVNLFRVCVSVIRPGTFHGVAIWMDFHLSDKLTVTTGLQQVRHD